jgi:hypothetical protein
MVEEDVRGLKGLRAPKVRLLVARRAVLLAVGAATSRQVVYDAERVILA